MRHRHAAPNATERTLTKHFGRAEFACPCCGKVPGGAKFMELVSGLERVRELLGKPVRVLSGRRCPEQNRKAGGAADSWHLTGEAADVASPAGWRALYEAALQVSVFVDGGIGVYPHDDFVHLDVRDRRRWARVNEAGKKVYVSLERGLEAAEEA